jgi:hypothetical protein
MYYYFFFCFDGYQAMSSVLPVFHLARVKSWRMLQNCHAVHAFPNMLSHSLTST